MLDEDCVLKALRGVLSKDISQRYLRNKKAKFTIENKQKKTVTPVQFVARIHGPGYESHSEEHCLSRYAVRQVFTQTQ